MDCSVLEMLIGLSRRLAFEEEGEPRGWFWHLIENLELRHFTDRHYSSGESWCFNHVDEKLDCLLDRHYEYDGSGGLFPLHNPLEDQKDVELWYQMSAYLLERE
jgi:hypothetical protein